MSESKKKGERKRTYAACDSCSAKKIKCDDAVPQCNWCMHHGIPCTFTRKSFKRKKHSKDRYDSGATDLLSISLSTDAGEHSSEPSSISMERRIIRIETAINENLIGRKDLSSPRTTIGGRHELTHNENGLQSLLGAWHFAGIKLGGVSRYSGVPFFSAEGLQWVESRCGQNSNLEQFNKFFHSWEANTQSIFESAEPPPEQKYSQLPDRQVIEAYKAWFQSSARHRIFPLVKDCLFNDTIRRAYQRPQNPSGSLDAVSCIYAFAAFVTATDSRDTSLPVINGTDCAKEAQRLLTKVLQKPATLDALQTVLMLSAFRLLSGDLSSADILLAIGVRLLFQLGGNMFHSMGATVAALDFDYDFEERAQVRTLFWVCYTIDKCLFLRTGRPPSIHNDDCDLSLPETYIEKPPTGEFETEEITGILSPLFPCDLRLSIIISNIYQELYSIHGLRKADTDVLMTIRKLDHDLETWRMSIDEQKRPQLSASDRFSSTSIVDTRSLMNRLEYHQCMGLIHQASSRCKSLNEDNFGMVDGISSSLALTVEVSRSSLLYLNLVQGTFDEEVFWFVMFYPISAIMTLFCYILLKPQNPRALDDLCLLNRAPALMKAILAHHSRSIKPVNMNFIEDFVADLCYLAKSAILKDKSLKFGHHSASEPA